MISSLEVAGLVCVPQTFGGAATLAKAMQEVRRASLERYAADAVEKESEAKAVDFDVQTAAAAKI